MSGPVTELDATDLRLAHGAGPATFNASASISKALDVCMTDSEIVAVVGDQALIRETVTKQAESILVLCSLEVERANLAAREVNEQILARGLEAVQVDLRQRLISLREIFRTTVAAAARLARARGSISDPGGSDAERETAARDAEIVDTDLTRVVSSLASHLEDQNEMIKSLILSTLSVDMYTAGLRRSVKSRSWSVAGRTWRRSETISDRSPQTEQSIALRISAIERRCVAVERAIADQVKVRLTNLIELEPRVMDSDSVASFQAAAAVAAKAIREAVAAQVRREINRETEKSQSGVMTIKAVDVGGTTIASRIVAQGPAYEAIEQMMQRDSSTIGIAGPRGIGKTTLISHFARRRSDEQNQRLRDDDLAPKLRRLRCFGTGRI